MDTVAQILKMLGCLGMFLFGMSLMSGGLQKFAGNSLRTFIARMTSNTARCLLTGFVVTALVQSSTATTLMLVSFVNAGLMTLTHAIGVIMGANIGTTFTAWLFALSFDGSFSLGAIAIPVMFFAFIFYSMKSAKMKSFGEFLMGFAFLFLGLATLKDTSYPILSSPGMRSLLAPLTGFGFGSTVIFIIIGAVMTLMLQSSAATTSITMLLLAAGVIPFDLAVAMVLGENIGTTITSNLAASVANVSAKRTARAHLVFNLFGSLLVIALFRPYLALNGIIIEALGFPNPCTADFSVLSMSDADGGVLSRNFYWQGREEGNFRALKTLPKPFLRVSTSRSAEDGAVCLRTVLRNTGKTPALMLRLKVTDSVTGDLVLPVWYEDNYFFLMPGEEKTVTARIRTEDCHGKPRVQVESLI